MKSPLAVRMGLSAVGQGISGVARESPAVGGGISTGGRAPLKSPLAAVGGGISKGAVGPLRPPEGHLWAERSDRP